MPNWAKDKFNVKNPEKYIGKRTPIYRSSWELTFMLMCDNNPNIIQWASEAVQIPYMNPLTRKQSMYVPDFLIVYIDKDGNKKVELIEVKPSHETSIAEAKNNRNRLVAGKNLAKWGAAKAWCARQGITFRVITEKDIFRQQGNQR
jgi:TnsA endonuclease N terminal